MDLNKIRETVENLTQNEKVKEVFNSDMAKNVMDKVKDMDTKDVENIVNQAKNILGGLKK